MIHPDRFPRQDTSSSADLSGVDKTRELVRLILGTDDIKRNLVASEFLALTEAEFQDILDEAAAILRSKKASHDRTLYDCSAAAPEIIGLVGWIAILGIFRSIYYAVSMQQGNTEEAIIGDEKGISNLMAILYCFALALTSINTIQVSGCIHACDSLVSRGKKIRELTQSISGIAVHQSEDSDYDEDAVLIYSAPYQRNQLPGFSHTQVWRVLWLDLLSQLLILTPVTLLMQSPV